MSISWPSFVLGLIIGFTLGFFALAFAQFLLGKRSIPGDQFLAYFISVSWVIWHLGTGLGVLPVPPPTMYDVISGGAVGFILGERFWDGLAGVLKK
jgi:hypothetical protein